MRNTEEKDDHYCHIVSSNPHAKVHTIILLVALLYRKRKRLRP